METLPNGLRITPKRWQTDWVIAFKRWITLNEPQCFVGMGHLQGLHAPGDKLEMSQVLRVMHQSLLAHGSAVQALRATCASDAKIGFAPTYGSRIPLTETDENIEAARKSYFGVEPDSVWSLALWADPVYLGDYPREAYELFGGSMPKISPDDLSIISQPLDFIGCNIYTGTKVSKETTNDIVLHEQKPGNAVGTLAFLELEDEAIYWAARFQAERYGSLLCHNRKRIRRYGLGRERWQGPRSTTHRLHGTPSCFRPASHRGRTSYRRNF